MRAYLFGLFSLILFLSGCGVNEDVEKSSPIIEQFHNHFSTRSYDTIYDELLHPAWRIKQKKAGFAETMEKFRNLTGHYISGSRAGYKLHSSSSSGTTLIVTFNAEFSNGEVVETFTLQKRGEQYKLHGYKFTALGPLKSPKTDSA